MHIATEVQGIKITFEYDWKNPDPVPAEIKVQLTDAIEEMINSCLAQFADMVGVTLNQNYTLRFVLLSIIGINLVKSQMVCQQVMKLVEEGHDPNELRDRISEEVKKMLADSQNNSSENPFEQFIKDMNLDDLD